MLLGAIRTKFLAVLLGPVGVGLMGTYVAITSMASTLTGFGIGSSGVRQIAEAAATGDSRKIARTIAALRRASIVLGAIGAILLALLSWPISNLTFKSSAYAWPICLLAGTVFFSSVSAGQTALVQGMRRIGDLSRLSVLGALLSTVIGVPFVFWLGIRAIVPLLIVLSLMTILTSWWYARKVPVERVRLTWGETWTESREMLKMGFAFLVSGILNSVVTYLIRVLTVRHLGVDASGQYQAAFTVAGLYAGFVLQAMAADFFPRLTAVAQNNDECNRLVNEQSEVSLLLAGPGILATLAFAPLVIHVFYAASFEPAILLLRWFALGLLLRVISWPMAYIMLAKGFASYFIYTEIVSNIVYIGLTCLGVYCFGLVGTAEAFVGLYVFYVCLMAIVAWKLTGFRWSRNNLLYGTTIFGTASVVFGVSFILSETMIAILGTGAALLFGLFSFRRLSENLRGTRFEPYLTRFVPKWLYSSTKR